MPLRRPPPGGPIRRSQFDVPALELREALSATLQAIAQRGAQVEAPEPPEPASDSDEPGGDDSDLEGPEPPSDDEDGESTASSSGASSLEASPVPSPTLPSAATSALPSTTTPAATSLSSTLSTTLDAAPTSVFAPSAKEEDSDSGEDAAESSFTSSSSTFGPPPTSASATAEAELSSESAFPSITADTSGAKQSGDVWIMSGPPPRPPQSGLSQETEHLLIAAGSIGLCPWPVPTRLISNPD